MAAAGFWRVAEPAKSCDKNAYFQYFYRIDLIKTKYAAYFINFINTSST